MANICLIIAAPDPYIGSGEISYICIDKRLHIDLCTGQVAVKINCGDCGKNLGYWCYDDVENALASESEREEFLCHDCWLNEYGEDAYYNEDDFGDFPDGHSCTIGG